MLLIFVVVSVICIVVIYDLLIYVVGIYVIVIYVVGIYVIVIYDVGIYDVMNLWRCLKNGICPTPLEYLSPVILSNVLSSAQPVRCHTFPY